MSLFFYRYLDNLVNIQSVREKIENIINIVATELNYLVYESSVYMKGEQSKLYVKLDHNDGVSHHDCEIYSRELSRRLDMEDLLPNYSLEISSPGINRKLRSIDEFKRFIGSKAKIVFEIEGKSSVIEGTINNVIDTKIGLKSDKDEMMIDFKNIIKANLEY